MFDPVFIHLRVHSAYSLLAGAISLKSLVKWCVAHRMPAVALTDNGNLFGSLEFALAASASGVQPIHAAKLYVVPDAAHNTGGSPDQLTLYVQNESGWKNLLELVSLSYLKPAADPAPMLSLDALRGRTDGLIALTGGRYGCVGKLLLAGRKDQAERMADALQELFPDRLYIELMRHGLAEEAALEPELIKLALARRLPLVATNDAYFIEPEMFDAHDAFLCIAEGSYVGEEERRRLTPHHRLKTPEEMAELFADIPEALENTVIIAKRCAFMTKSLPPMLPSFVDERGNADADAMLHEQAGAGLEHRLERHVFTAEMDEAERLRIARPYRERLEFEISTIQRMQFPGYFLIVSDFIKWSKAQGIPVGPGRGSGAGSLVAWALSITDLDPLRYGLLFERFLNPQRVSMPDFDVDFCQDRREEVIAYVQARYGRDRVAQIITFGKLQARAVLRDVGRVLQLSYNQVDRICKMVPNNPANPITLGQALEIEPSIKAAMREDPAVERLVETALKLEGLNRHASTHAAGVVIADRPLQELVPLYRDPKSDMPVVQYSMKYAESAGLVKFDFLGLKTLTVLVTAVKMVAEKNIHLDLLHLPEGDAHTYAMLGRGETVGVFQLEGAGMRDTVKKLQPDRLEDIIALVSLYRPGPMDNIPTYIARKHGAETPDYLHPWLEPILAETFGVIIYQEQVMQIAQVLAGYSLGEADLLRRAMGKKIRAEMEAQRDIFVEKSVEKGVDRAQAATIFDLIAKFAEYGFNKSHAAAYALVAYQTAYLKAHHTVEFIASSMTYDMHNTDKLGVFREDAGRFGIELLPPDINRSHVLFRVEDGHIRYALAAIRNVGEAAMQAVVEERKAGPFRDIFDFITRVPGSAINKRAVEFLIKAGAFDSLHASRAQLAGALDLIVAYGDMVQRERASEQESLFGAVGGAACLVKAPELPAAAEWPTLERLSYEFTAIGFYLSAHPLDSYTAALKKLGVTPSNRFADKLGSQYSSVRLAGIVTGKKIKASEKGRFAFIQLSDTGGMFEVTIYDDALLSNHRDKLENGRLLMVAADGKMEEAGPRLIVQSLNDLEEEIARAPQMRERGRLRIQVENGQTLPSIAEHLGTPNGHGFEVTLAAYVGGKAYAEIRLPGKYTVTPSALDRIRVLQGVVSADQSTG